MRYYKEFCLKNGNKCILRNAMPKDSAAVLNHLIKVSGETDYLARYPDEVRVTIAQEQDYLGSLEYNPRALLLCAFVDGNLTGTAGINPINSLERYRHRAELGISIRKEYWNQGIGTAMINALIEAAADAGYEQLELEMVTANQSAADLYRKLGFQIYGTRSHSFLYRDGSYGTAYLMYRPVS